MPTEYSVQVFHGGARDFTFTANGGAHNAISREMAKIIGEYLISEGDGNLVHKSGVMKGCPADAQGYFHYYGGNELCAFKNPDFAAKTIELLKTGIVKAGKHVFK